MPKISLIAPVYKAEKYLRKCVESVLAQTFSDFELILIDDKSPDNSGAICDELALLDSRIRVIHNAENQGACLARKTGLDAAKGEYIQFVDSDDWLEPTMIEKLYNKAIETNADMVYCDYYEETKERQRVQYLEEADKIERMRKIIKGEFPLHMLLWNRLAKKELYNKVDFPSDLCGHEDNYIMIQTHYFSQKAVYLNEALYHYIKFNENSMTYNFNRRLNMRLDYFNNLRYIKSFLINYFENDLKLFEPYFSHRVNAMKHKLLKLGFFDLKTLNAFHPQANSLIFQTRTMKLGSRIILWFALCLNSSICYKLFYWYGRRKRR